MAFTEKETAYCLEAFEQNPPLSWDSLQWCGFYATQNRFLSYGIANKAPYIVLSAAMAMNEEEEEEEEEPDDDMGRGLLISANGSFTEDRFNLAQE